MQRDWKLYADDILIAISEIRSFVAGLNSSAELARNNLVHRAIERDFEIIGEAVKNLPAQIKQDNSAVEWRKIAGFRDILAHGYFAIDPDVLWTVIHTKLNDLEATIKKILKENP